MVIDEANLELGAAGRIERVRVVAETLRARYEARPPVAAPPEPRLPVRGDVVTLSPEARSIETHHLEAPPEEPLDPLADVRTRLLALVIESLSGFHLDLRDPSTLAEDAEPAPPLPGETPAPPAIEVTFDEVVRETPRLAFEAEGVVRAAGGEEVPVEIGVTLTREAAAALRIDAGATAPAAARPLTADVAAPADALSERRFHFDLDADGRRGQVVVAGLRPLPEGPPWPSLERLRVFALREDGGRHLIGLGDPDLGAVYVGHITEPFAAPTGFDRGLVAGA